MKVIKNGDTIQKRTHKFKCWNCKCKYIASNGEWYYVDYCQKTNKPTDHVESECPECGKLNKIQWRHKKRDWLSMNAGDILAVLALLSLVVAFVFAVLNIATGFVISIVMFFIFGITVRYKYM